MSETPTEAAYMTTRYVEHEPLVVIGQSGTVHLSSDGGETWEAHRTREAFDRWLEGIDRQLMAGAVS